MGQHISSLIQVINGGVKFYCNKMELSYLPQSYNPWIIPPNITFAKAHSLAQQTGFVYDSNYNIDCPCCHLPIIKKRFSINCSINQFSNQGVGATLYFYYLIQIILTLCIIFAISLIFKYNKILENLISLVKSFAQPVNQTINNVGEIQKEDYFISSILVCTFAYLIYSKFFIQKIYNKLEGFKFYPSQFAIIVKNVTSQASKQDIYEFFQNQAFKYNYHIPIINVFLTYKIGDYINSIRRKIDLYQKREEFINQRNVMQQQNYIKIINQLESQIQKESLAEITIENHLIYNSIKAIQSDKVIIIFKYNKNCQMALKKWRMSYINQILYDVFDFTLFCEPLYYKNQRLIVEKAPEPFDIIWENLEVKQKHRLQAKIKSFIICFILFIICFLLLAGIRYTQHSINQKEKYIKILLTPLFWLVILLINNLLRKTIEYMVQKERNITYSEQSKNIAWYSSIAQFINTALIPYLLFSLESNKYNRYDMQKTIQYLSIYNLLFTSLLYILDFWYYYGKYQQILILKQGKFCNKTQYFVNKIFEKPSFNIHFKYAQINKQFFTACFYASQFPLLLLFEIISLIQFFWVSKYILINRSSEPKEVSNILNNSMQNFAFTGPLLFLIGWLLNSQESIIQLFTTDYQHNKILLTIIICLILFISGEIILNISHHKDNSDNWINYEDKCKQGSIWIDYDEANPITTKLSNNQLQLFKQILSNRYQDQQLSALEGAYKYVILNKNYRQNLTQAKFLCQSQIINKHEQTFLKKTTL